MNLIRWRAALGAALKRWLGRSPFARVAAETSSEWVETYGLIGRIATHAQPEQDLKMHLCRCSMCSVIRRCTPDFDFYVERERGPLICHDCFFRRVLLGRAGQP